MKPFLTSLLIVFILPLFSNAQSFNWVKGGGSTSSSTTSDDMEKVVSMCTDPNGNMYFLSVLGYGFPIIADTVNYTSGPIGGPNAVFGSYNCNGQMRFGKFIHGREIYAQGVAADNLGHVYVLADLAHDASAAHTLHVGYDTVTNANIYQRQALLQYDTSGHLNWMRFIGANVPYTYSHMGGWYNYLALDGSQHPHVFLQCYSGIVFRPSDTSKFGVSELEYDGSGNLLTVKHLPIDSTLMIEKVAIDKSSNKLYTYGYRSPAFMDSSDYNFIAAFDISRNLIWKDSIAHPWASSISPTLTGMVAGIVPDGYGNLYIAVESYRDFVFRGDTVVNTTVTGPHGFSAILKLDTAGNKKWIRKYETTGDIGFLSITQMPNNKIAAAGIFKSGFIFAGTDTISRYPGETNNGLFTILDSAGYVHYIGQTHGTGYDGVYAVSSDKVGNLYFGGSVGNTIWAGSLTPYASIGGDADYFLMKYGVNCSCTSMPIANYSDTGTHMVKGFTYTGTSSTPIDSVRWEFGDGTTSAATNPIHTYSYAGTYTACVTVYTACGSDMRCHTFTVTCAALPVASYTQSGTGLTKSFTYTGTTTGLDSVKWYYGDGDTALGLTASHTYAANDTYHVCVKVYTHCGIDTSCTDVIAASVSVNDIPTFDYVRIYPNPAQSELIIAQVPISASYSLLSITGKQVQTGILQKGSNSIAIDDLPTGIYMLEITPAYGQRFITRIIKQ